VPSSSAWRFAIRPQPTSANRNTPIMSPITFVRLAGLARGCSGIPPATTVKRHKVHCVYLCPVPPAFGQLPLIQQLAERDRLQLNWLQMTRPGCDTRHPQRHRASNESHLYYNSGWSHLVRHSVCTAAVAIAMLYRICVTACPNG